VAVGWEWAAPAATTVAAIVGVSGTYLAGNRQVKTSLDVAKAQGSIQATIAREERHQRRIEAAYTEIVAAITQVANWLDRLNSVFLDPGQADHPAEPEVPFFDSAYAATMVYWSPRVGQLVGDWGMVFGTVASTARHIEGSDTQWPPDEDWASNRARALAEFDRDRMLLRRAHDVLFTQVSNELRGDHDGKAAPSRWGSKLFDE
jgi:hypothetical protein